MDVEWMGNETGIAGEGSQSNIEKNSRHPTLGVRRSSRRGWDYATPARDTRV